MCLYFSVQNKNILSKCLTLKKENNLWTEYYISGSREQCEFTEKFDR